MLSLFHRDVALVSFYTISAKSGRSTFELTGGQKESEAPLLPV